MKTLIYAIAVSTVAVSGGVLVATSMARPAPAQQPAPPQSQPRAQPEAEAEAEDDDFIPTEKVPADSAISFPVDI